MKKLIYSLLLMSLLALLPATVLANNSNLTVAKLENAGWDCSLVVEGEPHCFDPGDLRSKNAATANVMVFNSDLEFEGTEILWLGDLWAGQPCPQDDLLFLGFAVACHHYSHD